MRLPIDLSLALFSFYISIYLYSHLSIHLSLLILYLSLNCFIYLSLSLCLSIYISFCLSIYLSICLSHSICVSMFIVWRYYWINDSFYVALKSCLASRWPQLSYMHALSDAAASCQVRLFSSILWSSATRCFENPLMTPTWQTQIEQVFFFRAGGASSWRGLRASDGSKWSSSTVARGISHMHSFHKLRWKFIKEKRKILKLVFFLVSIHFLPKACFISFSLESYLFSWSKAFFLKIFLS